MKTPLHLKETIPTLKGMAYTEKCTLDLLEIKDSRLEFDPKYKNNVIAAGFYQHKKVRTIHLWQFYPCACRFAFGWDHKCFFDPQAKISLHKQLREIKKAFRLPLLSGQWKKQTTRSKLLKRLLTVSKTLRVFVYVFLSNQRLVMSV